MRAARPLRRARYLLVFAALWVAHAQYTIDNWTTENGLPQNSVLSIQQTPDGYLWFATLDGLVRFDGVRFTIFNRANSPELPTNRLQRLLAEKDGVLWVCTDDSELVSYRAGKFQAFTTAGAVVRVQRDIDGSLLMQSGSGISHLRNGRIVSGPRRGLREYTVYVSPRGVRWQIDATGLNRATKEQESRYALPAAWRNDGNFDLPRIEEAPDGALWFAQLGKLHRFAKGRYTTYTAKDGLPESSIMAMMADREGRLWLGTNNDGVCSFTDNQFSCYKTRDGLSSNDVRSLFQDREGTIWAGTNDRGLNRLTRHVVTPRSTAAGLPAKSIYAVLEDRGGDMWLGSYNGLARMRSGRVVQFFGPESGLPLDKVQSLYEDRAGRLWIAGLNSIRYYANGRFVNFNAHLPLRASTYNSWFVREDAAGALWIGTDKGLLRYQNGQARLYTIADGLPSNDVKVGHWARDGSLWVGTYGGLARLDGERFVAYTEREGLASNHIRIIHEDEQGTLWIGTYDGGLSRLRDGRFVNYTTAQGLASNGVFMILEDRRGNFWMSSNQGIHRTSHRQLEDFASGKIPAVVSTMFGKSDGMLNIECNGGAQPAGTRTRDGKLWFPTQDGAAVIDPEAVPYNPLPPPIAIESAELQGRGVSLAGGLRLKPSDGNLEIHYTGLSFIKPDQIHFRYRLEPLDDRWFDAGTRRAAFYAYLPPGSYVFRVIASNSDQVWNEEGAALSIEVLPPFYRTWQFQTVGFLSAVGVAMLAWKRRVSQLEEANEMQRSFSRQLIESQESERKRMAAELHDSLGQHLLIIKNRADLGRRVGNGPNGATEHFDEITDSASQAIQEVRQIAYNLRPVNLERLGLTAVLEEMVEKISAGSGIQFSADIAQLEDCLSMDDAINVYRMIQESINNIVRHAHASKANLEIWQEGGDVHIVVADNGNGFTPESPARRGLGLTSITERVRMLGGAHTIVSSPGQGTTLTILLPARDSAKGTDSDS